MIPYKLGPGEETDEKTFSALATWLLRDSPLSPVWLDQVDSVITDTDVYRFRGLTDEQINAEMLASMNSLYRVLFERKRANFLDEPGRADIPEDDNPRGNALEADCPSDPLRVQLCRAVQTELVRSAFLNTNVYNALLGEIESSIPDAWSGESVMLTEIDLLPSISVAIVKVPNADFIPTAGVVPIKALLPALRTLDSFSEFDESTPNNVLSQVLWKVISSNADKVPIPVVYVPSGERTPIHGGPSHVGERLVGANGSVTIGATNLTRGSETGFITVQHGLGDEVSASYVDATRRRWSPSARNKVYDIAFFPDPERVIQYSNRGNKLLIPQPLVAPGRGTRGTCQVHTNTTRIRSTEVDGYDLYIPTIVAHRTLEICTPLCTVPGDSGAVLVDPNGIGLGIAVAIEKGPHLCHSYWTWLPAALQVINVSV